MNDTRQKILQKALELFNEKGIEYVGMRELATALGTRIGNITYYFPTKDDLVFALSEKYTASNSEIHRDQPVQSMLDFLKKNEILFRNRVNYRSLMLSMVHLMEQNAMIAHKYEETKRMRVNTLDSDIKILAANKYLNIRTDDELWVLVSVNSLLGRFWMSEGALNVGRSGIKTQVAHYLKLLAHLLKPYATKKGLNDIDAFLDELGSKTGKQAKR